MKDDDDRLTGYGIEFLNLVSEYSRLNFQYTGYDRSWSEMLTMLENGEIDVVTSARRTSDREELFAFSLPIGRNNTILSIRVDNTQIHRGDYKTYNGMTGEKHGIQLSIGKLSVRLGNLQFILKIRDCSQPSHRYMEIIIRRVIYQKTAEAVHLYIQ